MELADFDKLEQIRARVDQIVQDPVMAEALKPWYRQFCKRPCFHDDYLPTFNRPNVTLVDTDGRGVERITEHSVWANGVEYPVDCLIYATGFEVGTDYARRAGYEVHGRDGVTLTLVHARSTRGTSPLFTRSTRYATHGSGSVVLLTTSTPGASHHPPRGRYVATAPAGTSIVARTRVR